MKCQNRKLVLRVTPRAPFVFEEVSREDCQVIADELQRIISGLFKNSLEINKSIRFSYTEKTFIFYFLGYFYDVADYDVSEIISENWSHPSKVEKYSPRKKEDSSNKFFEEEEKDDTSSFVKYNINPKKHLKLDRKMLLNYEPPREREEPPDEDQCEFLLPKKKGSVFTQREKDFLIAVGKKEIKLPYFTCYNTQFRYYDFVNFFVGRTIELSNEESTEENEFFIIAGIKNLLKCVCAKISKGDQVYYILRASTNERSFDYNYSAISLQRKTDILRIINAKGKETCHPIWGSLLNDPGYNGTYMRPYFGTDRINDGSEESRAKGFNLFQGYPFDMEPTKNPDMKKVQPILDFIREAICNNDGKEGFKNEGIYDYFIKYLSFIFRHHKLANVCMILFSANEGAGKGTLAWFIIKHCLGVTNSAYSYGGEGITTNFNGLSENSVFTIIDESPAGAKKYQECRDLMGKYKSIITEEKRKIEEKNVKAKMIDNIQNLMFCTNNANCVTISPSNRRFCFIQCNEERANDREYFAQVKKDLKEENAGYHFFSYLYNLNISEDEFLETHHPVTPLEREVCGFSRDPVTRFVGEHFTEEGDGVFDENEISNKIFTDKDCKILEKVFMSSESMHNVFKKNCNSKMSRDKFTAELKKQFAKMKIKHEWTQMKTTTGTKRGALFTLSLQKVNI